MLKYIDKNGNVAFLENTLNRMSKLDKVGDNYFEKKEIVETKKETKKEVIEVPAVIVEKPKEILEEVVEENQDQAMKEFLKEKKVRGYGLLKGESLKAKAIENGFILNQ